MKASRLNNIKDIAALLILVGFVALVAGAVMPRLQADQLRFLEERYISEQRRVVSQTVENAGLRIASLNASLARDGVSPERAERAALELLGLERYGINGYGYFYAYDYSGAVLLHPVLPELVGRRLDDIRSPAGENMGELFRDALGGGRSAFVEYSWTAPGRTEPERKTAFILRLDRPAWYIVSGFYHSDLEESLDGYARLTSESLRRNRTVLGSVMLAAFASLAALAFALRSSILATEKESARQLLSLERYKLILDESSMVSRTDTRGVITYVNDAFCETTGFSRAEAIGKNQSIERHPDTPLEAFKELWTTIEAGNVWRGVIKNRKADGSSYYKRATIVPMLDESGAVAEYISSGQDVTEIVEKNRDIEDAFLTDPLTGLGNRIHLLRDIERTADPCVSLIDIDGFSSLNRALGTQAGDAVLRQMAEVVLDLAMERGATAYRVQADEFAVLMARSGDRDVAECAEAISRRVKDARIDIGGSPTAIIARIGIAKGGKDSFLLADDALKRAKAARKMVHVYDPSDADASGAALGNLETLRIVVEALERDRVYVAFQPIVDVSTREIVKYECLMRMEDGKGNVVMPDAVLDLCKKTDRYHRLTMRVIELSIEAFRHNGFQFSINFSVDDLMNPETVSFLVSEAREKGVSGRLVVEIVETEELRDFEGASEVIERLRDQGILISVDDFGSGYSNFEYLLKLDPDFVKLDRSIVQGLVADERAREMTKSVVRFAKASGMRTVAEFIDSEELLSEIRELGVDYAQGWLFGKAERTLA
ncbi:MAG: EAL domain-containing protein [Spirochaetes bacterium]|nr:EAL domain-containing protein [Spirochaetota bacterium]MBU1079179.1 EAL domain-containing protein [Spirochaetota bacterium]